MRGKMACCFDGRPYLIVGMQTVGAP